jgi:hypothetical protein
MKLRDRLKLLWARIRNCWRSTTIWFNGVAGTVLLALPEVQNQLPQLQDYIPQDFFRVMMGVVIAANVVLRIKTTSDLADKGKK